MALTPFMLERSDIWYDDNHMYSSLRVIVHRTMQSDTTEISTEQIDDDYEKKIDRPNNNDDCSSSNFSPLLTEFLSDHVMKEMSDKLLSHVSSAVFQERLR